MPPTSISAASPVPARARAAFTGVPLREAAGPLAAKGARVCLQAVLAVLPAYAASRALLLPVAWLANATLGYARPQDGLHGAAIQGLLSWDAASFLLIARAGYSGYPYAAQDGFLPGFPAFVNLFGASDAAAIGVGMAMGLGALATLRAVAREFDPASAGAVTWVAALSPAALYWSAAYSEALFAIFAGCALIAARRDMPWLAGLLGALAAITRLPGAALALPLAILLRGRSRLAATLPALTLALWMAWLWADTGDPLAYLHSQMVNHPVGDLRGLQNLLLGKPEEVVGLVVAALLAASLWLAARRDGPLGAAASRRDRAAGWLLVLGFLAPAAAAGTLGSLARYAMVTPPVLWGAARLPRGLQLWAGIPGAILYTFFAASGRLTP